MPERLLVVRELYFWFERSREKLSHSKAIAVFVKGNMKLNGSYELHLTIREASLSAGTEWSSRFFNWLMIRIDSGTGYWMHVRQNLELEPGSTWSEIELSERLGLGRTPVREALKKLEDEHLVTVVPRQGARITEIDIVQQLLMLEMRRELEPGLVTLCGLMGEHARDALVVGLDANGKALLKLIWREYEKQRYTGQG